MSNRRKLAPHEIAKRDQAFAFASDHARTGQPAMVVQHIPPGYPCCWCDCPDVPDSPHITIPGYVCDNLCPDPAEYCVQISSGRRPVSYQVCDRHHFGPLEQLTALGIVDQVVFGEPWMDA